MLIISTVLIVYTFIILSLITRQWHFISTLQKSTLENGINAQLYHFAKLKLMFVEWAFNVILIAFWLFTNALSYLETLLLSTATVNVLQGLLFFSSIFLSQQILSGVSQWISIFRIEKKYGFSRMSGIDFMARILKQFLLRLLIMLALTTLGIMLYLNTDLWWIWISMVISVGLIIYRYLYPVLIAPMFHEFVSLNNIQLKQIVRILFQQYGFSCKDILVMNQSRYSTKGNAYVSGLGKEKRIIIFDTLLHTLSVDELAAVIAHELGHLVHHHIAKYLLLLIVIMFFAFAAVAWFISHAWWQHAFPITETAFSALASLYLLFPLINFMLLPIKHALSRQFEYTADQFAAKSNYRDALINALQRLALQNAALNDADKWFMRWFFSHPTIHSRITALQY